MPLLVDSYQGGAPAGAGPPAGAYMGPPGYQQMPGQQPSYMQQPQTIVVQPQSHQVIAVVGGCPACRVRQELLQVVKIFRFRLSLHQRCNTSLFSIISAKFVLMTSVRRL